MAHTLEDLILEVSDKYIWGETEQQKDKSYKINKKMLWEFLEKLHHPMYIEKLSRDDYKDI
jgi:hypothetical protein